MAKVISILSGKGGVGKTFLTANLAHATALQRRSVLVFDGDLGLANIDIQIGLVTKRHINDFILGDAAFEDVVAHAQSIGCSVISGRPAHGLIVNTTPLERRRIKEALARTAMGYDAMFIDLGAGIEANVIDFVDLSDLVLLIVKPEPTSIMDAYAVVKALPFALRARVVITPNMVQTASEAEILIRQFGGVLRRFLQAEPRSLGFVRTDANVSLAIRRQQPIASCFPASPAAQDIRMLADRILMDQLQPRVAGV
ncbi:AAA family ATPase [Hyphomonas sp.]|jgi:flagellar biosynthesis protein FlhG|uniref:nucleotide-binding protein n=1 Tax=Hyphomonas sp. TaxID=87 RepID=UPI0037C05FB1